MITLSQQSERKSKCKHIYNHKKKQPDPNQPQQTADVCTIAGCPLRCERDRYKAVLEFLTGHHVNGEDQKVLIDEVMEHIEARYRKLLETPGRKLAHSITVLSYFEEMQKDTP